jgi:predicted transposase/invertase (TIGR01784 family)
MPLPHDLFAPLPPDLALLDPTLDVVFERFFTEPRNEALLRDFLASVLGPRGPIEALELLGPRLPKRHVNDKPFVVDLRVRFASGEELIVEMQRYRDEDLPDRVLGYGARGYAHQLEPGERHGAAAPVRVIVFLTFVAFPELGLRTDFCLRDKSGRHVFTRKLEVILVQMPRLGGLDTADPQRHSDLARWIRFFQAKDRAAYAALAAESLTMSRAVEALAELSADRDLRRIAEDHAFALRLREQRIEQRVQRALEKGVEQGIERGIEQGIERGIERGIEEGRALERRQMLLRILTKRFGAVAPDLAARIGLATAEELDHWADLALDAPNLEAVFAS